MQAIIAAICLMITFAVGYSAGKAASERDELRLAQQYQAKAETAEQNLIIQTAQIEVAGETALADLRTRYDAARLRAQNRRVVVSNTPACATSNHESANTNGLSASVARAEVAEYAVIDLLEAADIQTQSLLSCQAYINTIHNKQP